eukprot:scaffold3854_cov251-Pinguiococcus_pyrenoidosus.AAC.10
MANASIHAIQEARVQVPRAHRLAGLAQGNHESRCLQHSRQRDADRHGGKQHQGGIVSALLHRTPSQDPQSAREQVQEREHERPMRRTCRIRMVLGLLQDPLRHESKARFYGGRPTEEDIRC